MERRVRRKSHARCGVGEKLEIISKAYLSLFIVVLLVVVVGAFFLTTYQGTIEEIWEAIVDKIYDTFNI
mgnify:CR=1 FL=1